MFYVPHWIWKNWEEGKMRMISDGLRGVLTMPIQERRMRQDRLVRYLVDSMSTHNTYAFGYFFCEFLNVLNVVSWHSSRVTFDLAHVSLCLVLSTDHQHRHGRQIPRRKFSHVRNWCHQVFEYEPGESFRPNDWNLSTNHEMHVPQIWSFRIDSKAW